MYRNQSAITLRDTLARPTLSAGFVGDDALREGAAGASLSNGDTVLASVIRWAIDRYFTTNN